MNARGRVSIVIMATIIFVDSHLLGRWLQPQVLTSTSNGYPGVFFEVVQMIICSHTDRLDLVSVTRGLPQTALRISLEVGMWYWFVGSFSLL